MIVCGENTRLEDFGVIKVAGPEGRLEEYKRQCRELPKIRQARWWLEVLEHDSEVKALSVVEGARRKARRRGS